MANGGQKEGGCCVFFLGGGLFFFDGGGSGERLRLNACRCLYILVWRFGIREFQTKSEKSKQLKLPSLPNTKREEVIGP